MCRGNISSDMLFAHQNKNLLLLSCPLCLHVALHWIIYDHDMSNNRFIISPRNTHEYNNRLLIWSSPSRHHWDDLCISIIIWRSYISLFSITRNTLLPFCLIADAFVLFENTNYYIFMLSLEKRNVFLMEGF